jgi:calcineurin-like phosphoesterase family protein
LVKTRVGYPFLGASLAFLLSLAAGSPALAQSRIVAIGDVHGAYPEFVSILQRVGLIDGNRNWIGGSTVLVQTGDVVDRGPASRQCLDLLMDLERQAEKQNGKVIPLLGNHEVMTLMGDLRYASVEDYRSFATEQSEKVREQAYQDYRKSLSAEGNSGSPRAAEDEAARQKWFSEHPVGFFERRDAFGPEGFYGRWVRKHDVVARVSDGLFMHGGLSPKIHFRSIQDLNDRVHSEIATFDSLWKALSDKKVIWRYMTLDEALRQVQEVWTEVQSSGKEMDSGAAEEMQKLLGLQNWLVVSPDSPLWYRGLALDPEDKLAHDLDKMLARVKANYIVAAHTVRPKFDVMARFNNRVFLIDTGMLRAYFGGRASALEIQGGRVTAYYADSDRAQVLVTAGGATASPPGANSEEKAPQP